VKSNGLLFRSWFYFRTGWSTYFAFILAATNTLTVTYFLAIDNYPSLKLVFPSFETYIISCFSVGIPLLIFTGYMHYKRSKAYKAEADITFESNPHLKRIYRNTEYNLKMQEQILDLLLNMNKDDLTDEQITKKTESQKIIKKYIDDTTEERLKE